jgi:hypothetical protein
LIEKSGGGEGRGEESSKNRGIRGEPVRMSKPVELAWTEFCLSNVTKRRVKIVEAGGLM